MGVSPSELAGANQFLGRAQNCLINSRVPAPLLNRFQRFLS
jgi:hypothetical protein